MGGKKFKMNKELKEIAKSMERLTKMALSEALDKAITEKCTLSVVKGKDGKAKTEIEGSALGILITLAGLEKAVLEHIEAPAGLFEMVKEFVGTEEAE